MILFYFILTAATTFVGCRFLAHAVEFGKVTVCPQDFTHHATFYGVPIYFRENGEQGCDIVGRNVFYDWLVLDVVPHAYWLVESIRGLDPEYESEGFPFKLTGEIHQQEEWP